MSAVLWLPNVECRTEADLVLPRPPRSHSPPTPTFPRAFPFLLSSSALASSLVANCVIDLGISASLTYTLRRRVVGIDENRDSFLTRMAIVILQTAAYTTFLSLGGGMFLFSPIRVETI